MLTGRGLVPARELDPHGRGQSAARVGQRAGTAEYVFGLAQRVFRRAEQPAGDGGVDADYLWQPIATMTGVSYATAATANVVGGGGGFSVVEPEPSP